jgi:hypothetical protein
MSVTPDQQFPEPKDREQLLEFYIKERLREIGAVFGRSGIEGLKLEWVSGSSIKVKTGAADFADGSRRLSVTSDITVPSISLGANATGHVYLYNNAGVPAVEVIPQTTAAPTNYFGAAYQKGSDSTRRFLGSVCTDAGGNIYKFLHQGDAIHYLANTGVSPFRVLNAGTATSETDFDLSAVVPVTARIAGVRFINTATNAFAYLGNSMRADATNLISTLNASSEDTRERPLDASRQLSYKFNTAPSGGGALYADVLYYRFER